MLSRTAKLQWGLGHQALTTIYKGAIIPILTYGAPMWAEVLAKKKNIQVLRRVQRLINIKIGKAHRTLSFEASCIVAGAKPIDIKIHECAQVYKETHEPRNGLPEYDAPTPVTNWPHPADITTIDSTNENIPYTIEIYTDGSKYEGRVGAAGIIFKQGAVVLKVKSKLHNECSNNQAELFAILQTLKSIDQIPMQNEPKTIAVYTDSQISLALLKNYAKHGFIVEEIRKSIRTLKERLWTIHFGWVKAHAGILGNEMADRLAKDAGRETDHIDYDRKPKDTIISTIEEEGLTKWQDQWTTSDKGADCRKFLPNIRQRLKHNILVTPNMTAMITGHGRTRAYLHRFHIIDDPECPCKQGQQTPDHLIYYCKKLQQQRDQLKSGIKSVWPVTHQDFMNKYHRQYAKFVGSIEFKLL
mgnify:FL=1